MKKIFAITMGVACLVCAGSVPLKAQSLLPAGLVSLAGDPAADAPDAQLYADGVRALHENRWADAVKIFDRVIAQKADHAIGALYWKAYALGKEGQTSKALETCATLRSQYASSSWKDDCGALEVELRSANGQIVQPKSGESDDVKLLALAKLMLKDPKKGKEELDAVLAGNVSEHMREGALYILGQAAPETSYPQIVRISYLEGDVRIARGGEDRAEKNAWDTAVMNFPLSVGDSLATGEDGRVEIEFEDASTVYLGPKSVVTFNDLKTTHGVPFSDVSLVSGTMNTYLDSMVPGERFVLRTPTNTFMSRYPQKANIRVSSYADGIEMTSLDNGVMVLPGGAKQPLVSGKTLVFGADHRLQPNAPTHHGDFVAWDAWAADRHAARTDAEREVMQEARLSTPLPGLADMKGKGKFFECPPYGMCWQPDAPKASAQLVTGPPPPTPDKPHTAVASPVGSAPVAVGYVPCLSGALYNYFPSTVIALRSQIYPGYFNSYEWAACHSGGWIYQDNSYAWVVGSTPYHHPPVRWVRFKGKDVFVPIHPRDIKGQPPLNREHAFAPTHVKNGRGLESVRLDGGERLNLMKTPPREFRSGIKPVLTGTQPPKMLMYSLNGRGMQGAPIRFNPGQGFTASHQAGLGGNHGMVFVPVAQPAGGRIQGGGTGATSTAYSGGMNSSSGMSSGSYSGGGGSISVSSAPATSTAVSGGMGGAR